MKKALLRWIGGMKDPQDLRREIRDGKGLEIKLRRAAVCSSLVGIASMAVRL